MSGDTSDEPTGIGTSDAPSPPRAGEDERCRLKELPPEIRNDIFASAIVEPTPIKLTVTRYYQQTAIKITRNQYHNQLTGLSLASTCRQFRKEAIQVFYVQNTFSLELARFAIRTENTTLKFPLHKATSIMFKTFGEKERDSWTGASVFIEPKLHVEKLADGSLRIRASECAVDDPCVCTLNAIARRCNGPDCLVAFTKEFVEQHFWSALYQRLRYYRTAASCTRCGKLMA